MRVHTMMMWTTFLTAVLAVLFAACSPVDEITPRHYVGLVVGHSSPLKVEIAKSLIATPGQPVPQAGPLQLLPPPGLAPMKFNFGWVTTGGVIVIQSTNFAVVVVQEPILERGHVTWSCIVHPAEAKPKLCGADSLL